MKNLAGNKGADTFIVHELQAAGIPIVSAKSEGEVPYNFEGKLGNFTFRRAWYYWVVSGEVPLAVARELYSDDVGKRDVRVAGHCGCPPPEEWAFPRYEDLVKLGVYKDFKNMTLDEQLDYMGECPNYGKLAEMCNGGKIEAPRFVDHYHVDSQEGLNLFVDTIKAHGLHKQETP